MAIALDGAVSTTTSNAATVTSLTYSHTIAAGLTNSVLIVWVSGAGHLQGTATWNGTAMTSFVFLDAALAYDLEGFYLVNPQSGTFNVSITWGGAAQRRSAAYTLTGVAQTAPIGATNKGEHTNNASTITVSVTTTTSNNWVINHTAFDSPLSSYGVDEVELNLLASTAGGPANDSSTRKSNASPGSVSMTTNMTANNYQSMVVAEVKPAVAAGGIIPNLLLMNVG